MKELQRKPEVIVFAGPNGSGKSTFTELLRPADIDYINAYFAFNIRNAIYY